MRALLRSAFVIGRRDVTATVFSKAFLFFLIGPLFPLLIGGIFGGLSSAVISNTDRPAIAAYRSGRGEGVAVGDRVQALALRHGEGRVVISGGLRYDHIRIPFEDELDGLELDQAVQQNVQVDGAWAPPLTRNPTQAR